MKICIICNKPFEYRRKDRATLEICGSCMTNRHRWSLKAACVNYKGGACQLCGYNKCYRALSFHHIDPNSKSFNFTHNIALHKIKAELDKCICVCKNCHEEIEEALEWGKNKSLLENVNQIAKNWIPKIEFTFSRTEWKAWHPNFR